MFIRRQSVLSAVMAAAVVGSGAIAFSQEPPAVETPNSPPVQAPASTAPATAPPAGKALLGLSEIESLLQKQGIRVHELEVRDRVVEAEGRDASNRKVELLVDRRSGEILSRRFDD